MITGDSQIKTYPSAFEHAQIEEVFPNIFFVTGASIYRAEGVDIQKSNNMVIVRSGSDLTLINTLRLSESGLKSLDSLGKVKNVVRLGAFHDRNDPFYLDRYKATLWAIKGMIHKDQIQADVEIPTNIQVPFPGASFFVFETATQPEGILYIDREGGILVTCDSIKNWTKVDAYFSEQTGRNFSAQGLIAPANIDMVWLSAMKPKSTDFAKLKRLKFRHLLSAHGQPLLNTAFDDLAPLLKRLAK